MAYDHKTIEKKWQRYWKKNKTFKAEINKDQKKYYALDMFPYPSGQGLHGNGCGFADEADAGLQRAASNGLGCVWAAG